MSFHTIFSQATLSPSTFLRFNDVPKQFLKKKSQPLSTLIILPAFHSHTRYTHCFNSFKELVLMLALVPIWLPPAVLSLHALLADLLSVGI